jgi:hypothetical protein
MLNSGLTGIWAKQRCQPIDCTLVIFPLATHITYPRWEVRHSYKFFIQPGEICNELQAHHPCLALVTWKTGKIMIIAQATPASFKIKTPALALSRLVAFDTFGGDSLADNPHKYSST